VPWGGTTRSFGCSRTEPEEFTELFRRHAPDIQRYVTRRLGSGVLSGSGADDIVAETFLLAFRQRDRYDPSRADARAWLYGICTNLIGRHRRAEIRQYRTFAWRITKRCWSTSTPAALRDF
jgi:DNA-directed RNA polymerase specialized sigma24 family protein